MGMRMMGGGRRRGPFPSKEEVCLPLAGESERVGFFFFKLFFFSHPRVARFAVKRVLG